MATQIIISLISFLGSALATFGGIFASSKLTAYRIEQLEKKQDKHNAVIERTYRLEEIVKAQDDKIKETDRRVEEIERRTRQ